MATRNVIKSFKLNTPKGFVSIEEGTQEIDDAIVDHWFVKAHLEQAKAKSDPKADAVDGNANTTANSDDAKSAPKADAAGKKA